MKRTMKRLQAAVTEPDQLPPESSDPLSFAEIRDLLCAALCARARADACCCIVDVYPASVVYQIDGDEALYQCSYSIDAAEAVTLGEPAAVEREVAYVPIQAACELLAASDSQGQKWQVKVIEFGPDRNGAIYWDQAALVAALDKFEGAKVFALNDSQHQDPKTARRFGKSPRELVGALTGPTSDATGIYANLIIMPSAAWLSTDLLACASNNIPYVYGLSVDVNAATKQVVVAGKQYTAPETVRGVQVDVVYEPAAGGRFLQQLKAAVDPNNKEMNMKNRLLAALRVRRPDMAATVNEATVTEEQLLDLLAAVPTADAAGADTLRQMQLLASRALVRETLTGSGLPEPVQAKLRTQYDGQIVEEATLQAAVKAEKEMVDQLNASGAVRGIGEARVVRESSDKLQAAMDGLLQVAALPGMSDVRPFTSLRAAYTELTGDTEVRGYAEPGQRLQAAFDSSTFSYVLGNALYRRMINDYRETTDFGLSRIISNVRNAKDFRPLQAIRIQYFGDLPDVTPETDDYTDLGTVTDEKVEYSLNQKGGIITITRKMIINDDITAVNRIISRLPRAARRTKAKRAWGKFINNDTYKGDSTAIFTAGHNNLGAAAYSITTSVAARSAIAKQTEPGSGERLYLRPVTLAIPTDLWDTCVQVNQTRGVPGSQNLGNSMFQYFGINNENIIEVPFMTDVNDWLMFADPKDVEMLEVAYLNGQQEPEMFVADNPQIGQFFVADKLQYKIRDEYEFEVMDYRGAYKAVV